MTPDPLKREETLIPLIRARVAARLSREGFRVRDISKALNVTQAAVSQYLKGRRGTRKEESNQDIERLIEPLVEKATKSIRAELDGLDAKELLEVARELVVLEGGRRVLSDRPSSSSIEAPLASLRQRMKLELSASERYLELANRTDDEYVKLLFRMIASDSMRHADVISQVISWLERGRDISYQLPNRALLDAMLSIEDSATEERLADNVRVGHPVATLLLRWIDIDESKHERLIEGLMALEKRRGAKQSEQV